MITDFIGGGYKEMLGRSPLHLKVKSYIQTQEGVYARRDCKNCEGTGTTYISDGMDDVDGEPCNCVKYND